MVYRHPSSAAGIALGEAMSRRQRASSSNSQAARANASFILLEISRASFSNHPIKNRTRCSVSPLAEGRSRQEYVRAHSSRLSRLADRVG